MGSSQYVQVVNSAFEVFDKATGASIYGPTDGGSLWNDLAGVCKFPGNFIAGMQVRYDGQAQRWVFMKGSDLNGLDGQFHICFAVSDTSDATGAYNLYDFGLGGTGFDNLPEFTRLAVWRDGYYVAADSFSFLTGDLSLSSYAFDRSAMIVGAPANIVSFDVGLPYRGVLAADWDGDGGATGLPPPLGAPNYFLSIGSPDLDGSAADVLHVWQFHADFGTPANSTFTGPVDVETASFSLLSCAGGFFQPCVPQLGTTDRLDAVGDRLMYRAAYRNLVDHEAIVLNHTVNAASTGDQAGARWYELRDPGGAPAIFQQGTYAPDASWRWMGSIAMDISGNLALGYNKSDATIYPEIDITGRRAGDPLGTLGSEIPMQLGGGSQTETSSAWGRYSTMSVDPTDGCTFWYTQEYYAATGSFDWNTRIGSFKYPDCLAPPTGTLQGTVTDASNGNPLSGAQVTAGPAFTTTDSAGHYQLILPVGLYDMTVSKYGWFPGSASGVSVTSGGNTVRDFSLNPAPPTIVTGTVTDGSGQGWPLYARVDVSASGSPRFTAYTDPTTGQYSLTLASGSTYSFVVNAVYPGYQSGGGPIAVAGSSQTINWQLSVDLAACNALGYATGVVGPGFYEDFSSASPGNPPPGWTIVNDSTDGGGPWDFANGMDCNGIGNETGGGDTFANASFPCNGADDTSLITPSVDLSGASTATINFDIWCACRSATAEVDLSTDGGSSWTNLVQRVDTDPIQESQFIDITPLAAGKSNVKARFHWFTTHDPYAFSFQVDDVLLGQARGCLPQPGGLVVGNVRDANTGAGLNGATVAGASVSAVTATIPAPTPNDGFYFLFSPAGVQSFTASYAPVYSNDTETAAVVNGGVVRRDFSLLAGRLAASPTPLVMYLDPGSNTGVLNLNLTNSGGLNASFQFNEVNFPAVGPLAPTGPYAIPADSAAALASIQGAPNDPFALKAKESLEVPGRLTRVPRLAAGEVLNSYPTGLDGGFGIGFNTRIAPNDFWLSNAGAICANNCGDNKDYRFLTDGTNSGDTIDVSAWATIGLPADMALDAFTGKMWELDDTGFDMPAGCIHELDLVTRVSTGNKICPPFDTSFRPVGFSQRGLAFDPATDTFYAGSRYTYDISHFDRAGTLLDSTFIGLPVSGMAFNSSTGHLFVIPQFVFPDTGLRIYVLDPKNGYNAVGGFNVTQNGTPLQLFAGGLDLDCNGHLWLVDWTTQTIYEVDSGETGACDFQEIPWLTESPTGGTVAAGSSLDSTVTFDATGLAPGLRQAQLGVGADTPYYLPPIPVEFIVRFLDVADADPFAPFIYGLAGAGVTVGCGGNDFCPGDSVSRASMAVFIEKALHGAAFVPPTATGIFEDVPPGSFGADFIEQLSRDGITGGCGGGNFCPNDLVSRAQMAVLIIKAVHGAAFVPPPATGIFPDVPPGSFAADYIEQLFNDGVTAGCGGGNYCPDDPVTRAQMAVFVVKAFALPHYP